MDAPQSSDEAALQRGLRELAQGRGPSVGRLLRAFDGSIEESPDLQDLTVRAARMSGGNRQKAAAILAVIEHEINKLGESGLHPMCLAALRAGFRIDTHAYRGEEYDWLNRRLDRARAYGDFGPETSQEDAKQHWETGIERLAHNLGRRLNELSVQPDDWSTYLRSSELEELIAAAPSDAQQVFVERLIATYTLKGKAVREAITERLITATANNVDEYVVRASAPVDGGRDQVQIRALLNCRSGPKRRVFDPQMGDIFEVPMLFADRLLEGESCFFATQVRGQRNEDPIVEIRVTSHGIAADGLTLRVQFDSGYYPSAAWWFGECDGDERLKCPPEGDPHRLQWSRFGYLEHTFGDICKPLAKYGIAWSWP